jgi:hypothetical protein
VQEVSSASKSKLSAIFIGPMQTKEPESVNRPRVA